MIEAIAIMLVLGYLLHICERLRKKVEKVSKQLPHSKKVIYNSGKLIGVLQHNMHHLPEQEQADASELIREIENHLYDLRKEHS